jgi:hypothetical protein
LRHCTLVKKLGRARASHIIRPHWRFTTFLQYRLSELGFVLYFTGIFQSGVISLLIGPSNGCVIRTAHCWRELNVPIIPELKQSTGAKCKLD